MPQPTPLPTLTPQFCFNERALRDFLRLSRTNLDDSISTHLNSLLTPSTTHNLFPRTTPPRTPTSQIPTTPCTAFLTTTLLPTWSTRSTILQYCAHVSSLPDPGDPTLALRTSESEAQRQRVVDERLDPYSGRYYPREGRAERLRGVVEREEAVERIVRRRVWGVLAERCAGFEGDAGDGNGGGGLGRQGKEGWEVALDKWREGDERGMKAVEKNAGVRGW